MKHYTLRKLQGKNLKTENILIGLNRKTNLTFKNNTYKNDNTDSLHCKLNFESYLELFLPCEENDNFFLTNELGEDLVQSKSLTDIILFINKSFKN